MDIENICGGTRFDERDVAAVRQCYLHTVGVGPNDLVVLAFSHYTAMAARFGWRDARHAPPNSGANGADLVLLDIIDKENISGRFDRVVIASGDKIFAMAVAALQGEGVEVIAASRPESISVHMRLAAREVRYLPPQTMPAAKPHPRAA